VGQLNLKGLGTLEEFLLTLKGLSEHGELSCVRIKIITRDPKTEILQF
jgi:hypothetical protein